MESRIEAPDIQNSVGMRDAAGCRLLYVSLSPLLRCVLCVLCSVPMKLTRVCLEFRRPSAHTAAVPYSTGRASISRPVPSPPPLPVRLRVEYILIKSKAHRSQFVCLLCLPRCLLRQRARNRGRTQPSVTPPRFWETRAHAQNAECRSWNMYICMVGQRERGGGAAGCRMA